MMISTKKGSMKDQKKKKKKTRSRKERQMLRNEEQGRWKK
jgi:hypothetical protein